MTRLLDATGTPLPPKLHTWYSDGKDAQKLLEEKIDGILAECIKTNPNGKVKIQSYGTSPNVIKEKIISIDGDKIAKVTFITETESGNLRVELVSTLAFQDSA